MKGLLLKDYYILRSQKKMFAMILLIALMFLLTNDDPASGVSYCLFVLSFLSLSTVSYDDQENGLQYLFTLPTGRKTYVTAKYAFCLINSVISWFLLSLLGSVISIIKQSGEMTVIFTEMFLLLCVCLMIVGIMLPLHLKYGAEKARIVVLLCVGTGVIGAFVLEKTAVTLNAFWEPLQNLTLPMVNIMFFAAAVVVFSISYICSLKVVEKKEF